MSNPEADDSWSTAQLVEYLAALMEQPAEAQARRTAVERALGSLDAEVGVLFGPDIVTPTVVGLSAADERLRPLLAYGSTHEGCSLIAVPGLGRCSVAVVALDIGAEATRFLLVRLREDEFRADDMLILHGMAWVLDLVLQQQRLVAALNERQRLLEQVSRVERAIASRMPLPEVLETITKGASSLLGSDLSTMHLVHDGELSVASMSAASEDHFSADRALRLAESVAAAVFQTDALTRMDEPSTDLDVGVAMGAPVRENDRVVGSLVVVSARHKQPFISSHEQSLLTFADQVSLALSDARLSAIAEEAFHDPLTGLATRSHFLERLERALRPGSRAHVLFLDLDQFKKVNDEMGHAAGDDLLRQVGRRLRTSVHESGCLARFGGDEFALLLENVSDASADRAGRRMLSALERPFVLRSRRVTVGVSIGIASGEYPMVASDLLHKADIAMYEAKQSGGGRISSFRNSRESIVEASG